MASKEDLERVEEIIRLGSLVHADSKPWVSFSKPDVEAIRRVLADARRAGELRHTLELIAKGPGFSGSDWGKDETVRADEPDCGKAIGAEPAADHAEGEQSMAPTTPPAPKPPPSGSPNTGGGEKSISGCLEKKLERAEAREAAMTPAEQEEAARLSMATRDPRWNEVGDEDALIGPAEPLKCAGSSACTRPWP